jgi:hypothetical protein
VPLWAVAFDLASRRRGCFETVAQGIALLQIQEESMDASEFETALDLLKSQSATRARNQMDGPVDTDQVGFPWLKATLPVFIR